jgi:DNA-binding MarR family transcriptional regulator
MYVGMPPILPDRQYPSRVSTDLEEQSSELVVQAARLVRAVRRRMGHPAGIRILAVLDELGPLGVTALADADRSSQPTISGAVRHLVETGWVAKEPDPTDARRSLVRLTAQGRQRLARTGRTADEVAHAVAVLRDVMKERL